MKRRNLLLTVLAVALVLSAGIGTAWGYFTTYASARGGLPLSLGSHGELYEGFNSWTKSLQVANREESREPVYVRARAYGPDVYYVGVTPDLDPVPLTYTLGGENWTGGGDGYWYYSEPVEPGQRTGVLQVEITGAPYRAAHPELVQGESFNVVVVYETVAVTYDESGAPVGAQNADWSGVLDTGRTEEEVEP